MYKIRLNGFEVVSILLFVFLFAAWIGNAIYMRTEPNVNIFVVLWLIVAIFLISVFKRIFSELYNKNFPYTYKEIQNNYGMPLESFRCPLVGVGDTNFRGFFAKFDIYNECIVVSSFGRCLVITDFNNIEINKVFLSYYINIKVGESKIKCNINKKQFIMLDSKKIVQSELI